LKPEHFQQKHGPDGLDVNQDENQAFFKFYADYPLAEEACLDCFMPIKDYLKNLNFKKYLCTKLKMTTKNEIFLRKMRILSLFERHIKQYEAISTLYIRLSINPDQTYNFSCVQQQQQVQHQQVIAKKRRQNVAIMTMQQKTNPMPIGPPQHLSSQQPTSKQPPIARPQTVVQPASFTGFPSFLPTDQANFVHPSNQQPHPGLQQAQYIEPVVMPPPLGPTYKHKTYQTTSFNGTLGILFFL
jgi:hypothetical protein